MDDVVLYNQGKEIVAGKEYGRGIEKVLTKLSKAISYIDTTEILEQYKAEVDKSHSGGQAPPAPPRSYS